jgi:hypothetical protein
MRVRMLSLVHEKLGLLPCIERAFDYGASVREWGFGFLQQLSTTMRKWFTAAETTP